MIANKKLLLVILFISFCTTTIIGQTNRSLPFLEVNADARTFGMGNTNMGESESMYLYTNPTSFLQKKDKVYGSYALGIYPEIENNKQLFHAFSSGYKLADNQALMIGFRSLSGYKVMTMNQEGALESIKPADQAINIAYAFQFTPNLSAYLGGSYIHSDLGKIAKTYGLNAGAYHHRQCLLSNNYGFYTIGISLTDLGGKVKYGQDGMESPLPTSIGLGGSFRYPFQTNQSLLVALTTRYYMFPSNNSEFASGLGLEYELFNKVSLRTGYYWNKEINYLSMGLGCNFKFISLDVAYQKGDLNNLYQLGVHIQL
ncbi:MAG: PorV/PorQ family protein [Bacteroidaceae bacterium]|nr:PorV/PorQ family protein [Dysgonamonadaceae bacterium]MDD3309715.1 PorV/PorQ family protein [Dysgonamonadaceae bacterium]MDD4399455.1 PorV/PorQ family protein [Dysgonamonadaceae bacterium]